jgi:hypothetical protein
MGFGQTTSRERGDCEREAGALTGGPGGVRGGPPGHVDAAPGARLISFGGLLADLVVTVDAVPARGPADVVYVNGYELLYPHATGLVNWIRRVRPEHLVFDWSGSGSRWWVPALEAAVLDTTGAGTRTSGLSSRRSPEGSSRSRHVAGRTPPPRSSSLRVARSRRRRSKSCARSSK